jgi:hypothetical protein
MIPIGSTHLPDSVPRSAPWPAQAAEIDALVDVLMESPGDVSGLASTGRGGDGAAVSCCHHPVVHNVSHAELEERHWDLPAALASQTRAPATSPVGAPATPKTEPETEVEAGP